MEIKEHKTQANGFDLYYRTAGTGSAVVLLHGYTQTGHMWNPIIDELAKKHTVIIPDLRGFGNSGKPASGYDKKTMAQDVHALVKELGFETATVVGHDIGLMVAYAYAAQFPQETNRIILMDAFLPGIGEWKKIWFLSDFWHFHFYGETPLALVKGRERIYLDHFWNDFAADRNRSLSEEDRQFYTKEYAKPEAMRAGFEVFKAFIQDARDFADFTATKLSIPILTLASAGTAPILNAQTNAVATNVQSQLIKNSGHWLMEEAPEQTIPAILAFVNQDS